MARINFRLPAHLKARAEAAATADSDETVEVHARTGVGDITIRRA